MPLTCRHVASLELKSCSGLPHSCCQQSGLSGEALGCLDKTNWQQAPGSPGRAGEGKRIQTLQRKSSSWKAASSSSLFHAFTLIPRQLHPRPQPARAIRTTLPASRRLKGAKRSPCFAAGYGELCPSHLAAAQQLQHQH